jgi:hypothetical protein
MLRTIYAMLTKQEGFDPMVMETAGQRRGVMPRPNRREVREPEGACLRRQATTARGCESEWSSAISQQVKPDPDFSIISAFFKK